MQNSVTLWTQMEIFFQTSVIISAILHFPAKIYGFFSHVFFRFAILNVDLKILVHSIYLIWLSGSYNIRSFFLGLPKTSKFWTINKRFFCNLLHIQTEGPIVFSRSAKIPWQKSGKNWANEHQSIFKWILFSKNVLALQFSVKKSKQTDFFLTG